MIRKLTICLVTVVLINATPVIAKQELQCRPTHKSFHQKNILLNSQSVLHSKLFYLNNVSTKRIWINHPQGNDPHASAGWGSYLAPAHWSALLLSKKNFTLTCSTMEKGIVNVVDCRRVITVCEPSVIISSKENYWLVENKLQNEFIKSVNRRLKKIAS